MAQNHDNEVLLVVAMNLPGMRLVPGSIAIRSGCGHDAWIAPSSQAMMKQTNVRTICNGCMGTREMLAAQIHMNPGAAQELAGLYPDVTPDEAIEALGALIRESGGTFHRPEES